MNSLPIRSTIWAAVALCVLSAPTLAQDYPRLGLYGHMRGNGFPYTQTDLYGPLDTATLDAAARYHEVVLSASPATEYRPDVLQALRARRHDIRLLAYVLGHYIWEANSADSLVHYPTRYRRLVRDLGGYLYAQAGQYYPHANVNLAKRDGSGRFTVAEGLADLFHDAIMRTGLWDGIFFDQYCEGILWTEGFGDRIDYVRAGYPTLAAFDAGWQAGSDTLANRLRRLVGPDAVLVGNCGTSDKYDTFNGWMRENFPFQNGGTWYRNMLDNPRGYLAECLNFRQPSHNYLFAASDNPTSPYTAQSAQEVRFVLGSAALGSGYGVYAPADLDIVHPYQLWWYDEYAVDPTTVRSSTSLAHTGWLGAPLGPVYQMVWVGTNPDASTNPGFETDISGWSFWDYTALASVTRDATTAAVGSASARVSIPLASTADYGVTLETNGQIMVAAGQNVSATFWAKAAAPCNANLTIGTGQGYVSNGQVALGTSWKQYQVTFVPNASGPVRVRFLLGDRAIDTWLDDVHLQVGTTSIYRRDFQNGIVLVNPGAVPLTLPLERPFRKLLGTVDPITNNGAQVTQVTIQPSDALFLYGQDVIPPAAVSDMRAVPYFVDDDRPNARTPTAPPEPRR